MPTSTSLVTHTQMQCVFTDQGVWHILYVCTPYASPDLPFNTGGSIIISYSSLSVTIDWLNVKSQ